MNMIEKVARAIAQADEQNGGPPYEYRITMSKHVKEQLFDQAKAAIEAMREPTEEMSIAAGNIDSEIPVGDYNYTTNLGDEAFRRVWSAAIGAALKEA